MWALPLVCLLFPWDASAAGTGLPAMLSKCICIMPQQLTGKQEAQDTTDVSFQI